jgi:hypothetical protein
VTAVSDHLPGVALDSMDKEIRYTVTVSGGLAEIVFFRAGSTSGLPSLRLTVDDAACAALAKTFVETLRRLRSQP